MSLAVEFDEGGIPRLRFPEPFNAAEYFIDRHIAEGRGNHVAIRTLNREVTYDEPDMVAALGAALLAHQRLQKLGGIGSDDQDPDLNVG